MQKIFVGDVQGCADELAALLARAGDEYGSEFELWCVGDLVNRGPKSLQVLEQVRELEARGRAFTVLGNHDLALIRVWLDLWQPGPLDTFVDVLESADADEWIQWLRRQPLARSAVLETGDRFVMVHASVDPVWTLDDVARESCAVERRLGGDDLADVSSLLSQGRDERSADVLGRLTRCRSIDRDGSWSSDQPEATAEAWHAPWVRTGHDYGVVYGHWAVQGLHCAPGLRGLDSGCVHHGRNLEGALTGWLPPSRLSAGRSSAFDAPDDHFWQIRPRHSHYKQLRVRLGITD